MAATEYPKRQKYFANKFVRKMTKVCLANDIGPEACWMLTIIAHTEDAKQYRGPVTYFNGQLFPLVGLHSVDSLDRARAKAIKAGWLQYIPGAKGKAGTYWVSVPKEFQDLDDLPTDESEDEFSGSDHHEYGRETRPEVRKQAGSIPEESRKKAEGKCGTFLPVPNPDPDPIGEPKLSAPPDEGKTKKRKKKKDAAPRPRCPLFDVIAEMTSTDPKASGSFIAQVRNFLLEGDPPYTPEEVRALPAALVANKLDVPFTLGVIRKYIGLTRKHKAGPSPQDLEIAEATRQRAETQRLLEENRRRDEVNKRERQQGNANDQDTQSQL